ncbi:MAG TPA: hypothetical protein VFU49_18340 [Ktedonobacteraceae bacterium]|nr:hypothetical protein [Ktedonobacteraceae bacterium]
MSISFKQRLLVTLLLMFVFAIMSSTMLKPYAAVCYAIAIIAVIGALILAFNTFPLQQRKLMFILVPVIIVVCGVGAFVLLNSLHAK